MKKTLKNNYYYTSKYLLENNYHFIAKEEFQDPFSKMNTSTIQLPYNWNTGQGMLLITYHHQSNWI